MSRFQWFFIPIYSLLRKLWSVSMHPGGRMLYSEACDNTIISLIEKIRGQLFMTTRKITTIFEASTFFFLGIFNNLIIIITYSGQSWCSLSVLVCLNYDAICTLKCALIKWSIRESRSLKGGIWTNWEGEDGRVLVFIKRHTQGPVVSEITKKITIKTYRW